MSKVAFLFPGQGSQGPGMGASVLEKYPDLRPIYEEAEKVLGWRKSGGKGLLEILQEGPEDVLRQTEVAQPALFVTSYAAYRAIHGCGMEPDAMAGHSIGEYTALAAAGVVDFADGMRLVQKRGELMSQATRDYPGAMAAVLRLSPSQVEEACARAKGEGICVPVNFNGPEQIVIAGERKAVEKVSAVAKELGAKVVPLKVAGGFHSPLMRQAAEAMRRILEGATFRDATAPVCMNVDGQLHSRGGDIKEALMAQLDSPVQWVKSMQALKQEGCTIFVECGAGRVLSGLLRGFDKALQAFSTESAEALEGVLQALLISRKEPL